MKKKLIDVTEDDVSRICPRVLTCTRCPIHKVCAYNLIAIRPFLDEETEIPDELLRKTEQVEEEKC